MCITVLLLFRLFKMSGGFLKFDWNLETCIKKVREKFELSDFSELLDPNRQLRGKKTYMHVVYLYSTCNKKKFTIWEPRRGNKQQKVKTVTEHYDRFHAFGIPKTRNVVLMFTTKEQESRDFLRFSKSLYPGEDVLLVMPRQEGQVVQSPVINVRDPVLPIGTNLSIAVAVPPPSKVSQASYNFFDFVSKSVYIICATTIDNTCKGSLCDGQTGKDACACVAAPPAKHWSLQIAFGCDEFEAIDKDEVAIISNQVCRLFVHDSIRKWPLNNESLDPLDLDDSVSVRGDCPIYVLFEMSF